MKIKPTSASKHIQLHKENATARNEKSLPVVAVGEGGRIDKRFHRRDWTLYCFHMRIVEHLLLYEGVETGDMGTITTLQAASRWECKEADPQINRGGKVSQVPRKRIFRTEGWANRKGYLRGSDDDEKILKNTMTLKMQCEGQTVCQWTEAMNYKLTLKDWDMWGWVESMDCRHWEHRSNGP